MLLYKYLPGFLALHKIDAPNPSSGKAIEPRQSCSNGLSPSYAAPTIAQGWTAQVVAKSLSNPRGLTIDGNGALLVVEQRKGVTRITFTGNGTCLTPNKTTVVSQNDLTHGIALSLDNKTLYASSTDNVYSWAYNSTSGTTSGSRTTIVSNLTNYDHISRTLTMSKKQPGTLLVSRGSGENVDALCRQLSSGRSQVRAFDLSAVPARSSGYNYPSEGHVLGWGLRNDVGVAEHPVTGGIWSVENSIDDFVRNGTNVHTDNPAEKLNYLGALSDPVPATPKNYGYPDCVALWTTSNVPNAQSLAVGTQISTGSNTSVTDQQCSSSSYVGPRLVLQPHTAPLDILFAPDGLTAYVTFHGSWDRQPPSGYNMGTITFGSDGNPTASVTSTTALTNILSPPNINNCPNQCARPVSLAMDAQGRLFMSSDTTGEIWVFQKK